MAVQVVLSVLRTAAVAMVQICCVCLVGFSGAAWPQLQEDARTQAAPLLAAPSLRVLSRLSNNVFMPALTVAVLGAQADLAALRADWALLAAGFLATALGFAVADLSASVFRPDAVLRPALRVSVAHPNAFALPLLVLSSLCERPVVNAEFGGDAAKCTAKAAASLAVYLTSWHLCFWTYSIASLETQAPRVFGDKQPPGGGSFSWRCLFHRAAVQPNILALLAGVAIGVSPVSAALFRDGHRIGAAIQTVGRPLVTVTTLVMSASLANGCFRRRRPSPSPRVAFEGGAAEMQHRRQEEGEGASSSSSSSSSSAAAAAATGAGGVASSTGGATVESKHDEGGGDVAAKAPESSSSSIFFRRRLDVATAAWFVSARLVVVPVVAFGSAHVLRHRTLGLSPLTRLVILLELAMPGAQTVLVTLAALGLSDLAEDVAPYYVAQYATSIFTLTAFAAWALIIIYHS